LESAERISKAIKGIGTDDDSLVREIASHTNEQLFKVNLEYQKKYEMTLYEAIKSDTSGDYCELLVSLCMPHPDYRAYVIRRAIAGAGTDEDALIDVFAHASNHEIAEARTAYEFASNRLLEKDIADDLSGNFKKTILSIFHGFRTNDVHPENAQQDADEIYKKGEGKWGTDDDFFVRFFTTHCFEHIALVDAAYKQKYGHNLKVAVDKETSGSYCRLLKALVTPKYHYYAERIHDAIKGLGTKDKLLIRIFVLNNSYESLQQLRQIYEEKYHESLIDAVSGDTSGHYKQTFLGVLNRPI